MTSGTTFGGRSASFPVWMVALAFLGTAARFGYAFYVPDEFPEWRDSKHYLSIARNLSQDFAYEDSVGVWKNEPIYSDVGPTSFWLPVYPWFLAASFSLFGESPRAVFLLQAFVSGLTVFLAYECTRLLLGRRIAFTAAALLAINPYHIYQVRTIGVEGLATFFLLAVLALGIICEREIRRTCILPTIPWVGLSIVLGLGILERSVFIFVGFVIVVYLTGLLWHSSGHAWASLFAGFVAAFLILTTVSPWMIRNYRLWNGVVYETNSGINLIIGFNDHADGKFSLDNVPRLDPGLFNELERDRIYQREAFRWISTHPFRSSFLFGKKLFIIWNPVPATQKGLRKWLGIFWGVGFLGLTLLGLLRSRSMFRRFGLLYLTVLSYLVIIGLAFSVTRFRIPLEGGLAIVAAFGSEGLRDGVRAFLSRESWRKVA